MYVRRTISILAAALSIGVCVFITYISRDVDQGTMFFNLVFLAVMLIMVAGACLFGFRRLIAVCAGLKNAIFAIQNGQAEAFEAADDNAPLFQNEFLDDCCQQYFRMLKSNPNTSCDIQSFINEDSIENHVHRNLLEMIPDILTSLGILGTFVGLVMGLREFDPSGYTQMADSIAPLINGIKVAFITSIYGISLSLAFSFNLRSELSNLSTLLEDFLDAYYLNIRPPYEVDSLSMLLDNQKSQESMQQEMNSLFVHQMVQSFEQVLTPAFNRMTDGLTQVVDTFTEKQQQAVAGICETVVSEMRKELADDVKQIEKTVAALDQAQHSSIDFLNSSMKQMQGMLDTIQSQMTCVDEHTALTLNQLEAHTSQALDQLKTHTSQTFEQLETHTSQALDQLQTHTSQALDQLETHTSQAFEGLEIHTTQILEKLDSCTALSLNQIREGTDQSLSQMREGMAQSLTQMNEGMAQSLTQMNENTAQTLTQINNYSARSLTQLADAQQENTRISQEQKASYQDYIRLMCESVAHLSRIWDENSQHMLKYTDEIARLGPVQFNRELKHDLAAIQSRLQNIEKQQRVAMMTEEYSLDDDLADMLRNTLRKLDDLEELVSTPSLFRSRAKRSKGK